MCNTEPLRPAIKSLTKQSVRRNLLLTSIAFRLKFVWNVTKNVASGLGPGPSHFPAQHEHAKAQTKKNNAKVHVPTFLMQIKHRIMKVIMRKLIQLTYHIFPNKENVQS